MFVLKLLTSVIVLVGYRTNAANLPSYFSACSRSDPNLSKCALESGTKGLSNLLKGDSSINVPNLTPLNLTEIYLEVGPNLKFTFTDCSIYGLENVVLKKVDIDLKKNKLQVEVATDLQLIATYKVDGRILILPIVGEGPSSLNITDGEFVFTADLEYINKKKIKYLKLANEDLKFTLKKMVMHLENLFNGDPRLGPELNSFFAENWKEISDELYPALSQTIKQIIQTIAGNFLGKVPFDKLFRE